MKKPIILSFLVLLCLITFTSCKKEQDNIPKDEVHYEFVAPTKVNYQVGETLDLTGGKIIKIVNDKEEDINLTLSMVDSATIPSFNETGTFVIKISYESFIFQYSVTIKEKEVVITTYTITFVSGNETLPTSISNLTVIPDNLPVLEKNGYSFDGWYLDCYFNTLAQAGVKLTSNITLYAKWSIEEVKLTGIEVALKDEGATYVRTTDPSQNLKVREVYSDKSVSEWMDITSKNITRCEVIENSVLVEVSVSIKYVTYKSTINLTLTEDVLSVSEIKEKEIDNNYTLSGVVIAFASIISRNEMILMDKNTGEIISLGDIGEGKFYNGYYDFYGINIGDEIVVPVKLVRNEVDASSGNSGKLYASYIGGTFGEMAVISKDNAVSYSEETVTISSQQDLINFVSNNNRTENIYKKVKFRGEMNFIHYVSSDLFRFWFEDGNISNYENQMIEGISPVFSSGQLFISSGKNFQEAAFGDRKVSSVDWANPVNRVLEIEAIFIGGNGYYYQFVILDDEDINEVEVKLENVKVVSPKKTTYSLNTSLDLSGAELVFEYDIRSDITYKITLDMLDESTIPDFTKAGTYKVKGSYLGESFEFDIEIIEAVITGIEVLQNPNITTYSHRATFEDLDLNGGKIKVYYSDGSSDELDMTQDMAPGEESPNWKIGEVTYQINYLGHTADLVITFKNTAITISEFLNGTIGEVYEVTGIVVGPTSTHSTSDLLLKDKESMDTVSIHNTGIVGKYNALDLDESVLNTGDEVIVSLKLRQVTTASSGSTDKICGNSTGGNKDSFVKTIIKISENNEINWDFENVNVTVISNQDELVKFLNSESRFNSYVKFVGLKGYWQNSGYRIFLGSNISSTTDQKVNGVSPFLYSINTDYYLTKGIQSYFTNASSQSYTKPASTSYEIFAIFLGGSTYYHDFTILDDSWIVNPNNL